MTTERCVLWEKGKELASKRGFEMSQKCPMDEVCNGNRCVFIDSPVIEPNALAKFYSKLEKHFRKKSTS